MAEPQWSPVNAATADLLYVVADEGHPSADYEWEEYCRCLHAAADQYGDIDPNRLRPLVRGVIAPKRIGAFTSRALREGLTAYTGEWRESDDSEGRNAGKPCRVMRLVRASP